MSNNNLIKDAAAYWRARAEAAEQSLRESRRLTNHAIQILVREKEEAVALAERLKARGIQDLHYENAELKLENENLKKELKLRADYAARVREQDIEIRGLKRTLEATNTLLAVTEGLRAADKEIVRLNEKV